MLLERSEAYMAEAERLSHTGSWHLNVRTGEYFWSHESFEILGLDPQETKASYPLLLERIHPEDRSKFDQVRSAAISERKDFEAEFRLLLPGGLIKYAHRIGHCLVNESGDCEFIGAMMDTTERKRAQEELRRNERFLAEGQRLSRTASFSWRVATDEITWSEELYRIFEFDQSVPVTIELIGTRVHPEDLPSLYDMTDRARADGERL